MQEAMKYSQADAELWEILTDVPALSAITAIVCAILNVGLAGSGTFISGILAGVSWNKTQMVVGLIQLLTSPFLIGWVLSIYWSYLLVKQSFRDN